MYGTVELSRRLLYCPLNQNIGFDVLVFLPLWFMTRSVSAYCSILTVPHNYQPDSESHHTQSFRPSFNATVYCFKVGKENHCLADTFRHNLFRQNMVRRNLFWTLPSSQMDIRAPYHKVSHHTVPDRWWGPDPISPASLEDGFCVLCKYGSFNES